MKSAILLSLLLFSIYSCHTSRKVFTYPKQLVAVGGSENNTITIRSSGIGKTDVEAVSNAESQAFEALLFQGFPGSVQERPMIDNETESKSLYASFYQGFFTNKNYQSFIINSSNYTGIQKQGGNFYVIRELKINLMSLRTELENKGIIRKFGF